MSDRQELPSFVAPMLCKAGPPFDSDEFLFEVKWDGTRALAFIEQGGYRLVNRPASTTTTLPSAGALQAARHLGGAEPFLCRQLFREN